MPTDEQIRTAFHDRAGTSLEGVTPYPDLLGDLRRQHRQRARLTTIGAPLAVIVLTAGAIIGVHLAGQGAAGTHNEPVAAVPSPSASTQPAPGDLAAPGPEVRLFDHTFTMPPGWHVTLVRRRANSGGSFPHTRTESLTAQGGGDFLSVAEYRGRFARARYRGIKGGPETFVPAAIAGHPALTAVVHGPAGDATLKVLVARQDSLVVVAHGLPLAELEDIARAAVHSSP